MDTRVTYKVKIEGSVEILVQLDPCAKISELIHEICDREHLTSSGQAVLTQDGVPLNPSDELQVLKPSSSLVFHPTQKGLGPSLPFSVLSNSIFLVPLGTLDPKKVIFFGNTGVGKSTLLNSIVGSVIFQSGFSFARLTNTVQSFVKDKIEFIDTPGTKRQNKNFFLSHFPCFPRFS